ncbi:MAG: septal ring lytic transglycosylase RlpA family protein [Porticoccaceae bacterium]
MSWLGGLASRTVVLLALTALMLLTACTMGGRISTSTSTSASTTSSIPGVDGAPTGDVDVSRIPDAVPKAELVTRAGNKNPYSVFGKTYHLLPAGSAYRAEGTASWYGTKFHGRKTANGETYDMYGMTAAHKTLPIPSYVKVTNLNNQRSVIVRVNDRGPFHGDRIIDLSYAAAKKLAYAGPGTARVQVEAIDPGDYQNNTVEQPHISSASQTSTAQTSPSQISPTQTSTVLAAVVPAATVLAETAPKITATAETYRLPSNTFLQIGAFSSLKAAATLQERVVARTAPSTAVYEVKKGGGRLFKVLVGPFSNHNELRNIREALIQTERLSPFVVYDALK